jgi:NAD(P)-dependent dehydrogenase (short-subunit alcohol dehydrogenase family)
METVVITGANRGIGLALTRRFLEAGRRVIATCRHPDGFEFSDDRSNLELVKLDVTDGEALSRFVSDLSGEVVDVLLNNAGVIGGDTQNVDDVDYDAWREAFEVNTLAPFRLAVALRANLQRSRRPRVVTVSSQMGSLERKSGPGNYAYQGSKAAVNKVMQALALEFHGDGIVVCPVHPGWVRTDMGGPSADISAEESASGLFGLIERLTIDDTGQFWTWDGKRHPW